jgi:hypothetical protein
MENLKKQFGFRVTTSQPGIACLHSCLEKRDRICKVKTVACFIEWLGINKGTLKKLQVR